MNPNDLNRTLYALSCIGDHIEALTAYQALAALYPQHREAIRDAYERDQCDWGSEEAYEIHFGNDLMLIIEKRYAEWLIARGA